MGGSLAKLSTAKVYSGALVWWLPLVQRAYDGESNVRGSRCVTKTLWYGSRPEPCTVKLTSLEESNQCSSWAKIEDTIVGRQDGCHADRFTQTWRTCVNGV